jgi:NitT/TauT family transport system substrate-binding protein
MVGRIAALAVGLVVALASVAQAEVKEVRLSKQFGLGYLSMIVIENQKLIEKHAGAAGLGEVTTVWMQHAGPAVQIDALLAGQVDFIGPGVPTLATIWDRTVGTPQEVRALSAMQSMPYVLVTRNSNIKTIADFTSSDKIALPAVKLTGHALALEVAAAKLWGFALRQARCPHDLALPCRRRGGAAVGHVGDQLAFRQLTLLLLRAGQARHP